jgi:hypothetical protein
MKMKPYAAGIALSCLMLCAGCTPAGCASAGHCLQRLPEGELLPDAGKRPGTNGDLSADIRRLEHALAACALQVETVKDCQDKLDEESTQPARSAN